MRTMLTIRTSHTGSAAPIVAFAGAIVRVGYELPAGTTEFTAARVLVVGDLIRRVLEDAHGAQVLAAVISDDPAVRPPGDRLMIRPAAGPFDSASSAAADLGRRLDLLITPTLDAAARPYAKPTTIRVAAVHNADPGSPVDPATLRFALATAAYGTELELTAPLLGHAQTTLDRWRGHLDRWSRHPSRPIPPTWRARVLDALDDDLDIAAVSTMLAELEASDGVEAGAKFEAFAYLDRVLAVDLTRDLGGIRERT